MRLDLGPDFATLKAQLLRQVDAEAEIARQRYVTPGAGQALEYQATEAEARAYLAAVNPTAADYPFVVAEAEAIAAATGTAPPLAAVAQDIIAQASAWAAIGSAIKTLRRTAKLRIEAATTPAEARAAAIVVWPAP